MPHIVIEYSANLEAEIEPMRLETSSILPLAHWRVPPPKVIAPVVGRAPLANERVPAVSVVPPAYVLVPVSANTPPLTVVDPL